MADKKHVLIIDDDPLMLRLIRTYLQDEYNVTIVNSGKSALQFLDKHTPDIILLDYLMPDEDGVETMKNIYAREECKMIPIVFITGMNHPERIKDSVSESLKNQTFGYLVKPIEQEKLLDTLKTLG